MSSELITALASAAGLIFGALFGKEGLNNIIKWWQEKQAAKIKQLEKKIELKNAHISELKSEIELERERRTTLEAENENFKSKLQTNFIYLEYAARDNEELAEILVVFKKAMGINVTPA